MLKIIDLFSGGGGLSEGFRNKDFEFICHIEKEASACSTLKLRNIYYYLKELNNLDLYNKFLRKEINFQKLIEVIPKSILADVLNLEINEETILDIFDFIDERLDGEHLDGIIGGPPCQAYSTIGRGNNKHKKATDERIYLYEYYVRFLEKYQPSFFVFENVKGLLSFKDYKNNPLLPMIIESFDSAGYEVSYEIVNAQDYGVCQRRERLFLVGFRKDIGVKKNFFKILKTYKSKAPTIKELFSDLPKLNAGEQRDTYAKAIDSSLLTSEYRNIETDVLTQHISRPNNENDLKIYRLVSKAKKDGINLRYDELPSELITHSNTKSFLDRFKALDWNSVSHTVVAHISKDGHYYIHPDMDQNRSITIREAARIQGFPDNYYFETSRTSAFVQIGNAVPPKLSKKIASSILNTLENK